LGKRLMLALLVTVSAGIGYPLLLALVAAESAGALVPDATSLIVAGAVGLVGLGLAGLGYLIVHLRHRLTRRHLLARGASAEGCGSLIGAESRLPPDAVIDSD
jgi:hypothetical protein